MILKWLRWCCLFLSLGSVVVAGYLMLLGKQSIQELLDAVAITARNSIENPAISAYDGEHLSWRLKADRAEEEDKIVMLKQPVINLFNDVGEVMPIHADAGQYDKQAGYIRFDGAVELGFQDWTLYTNKLEFFQEKGELHIKEGFKLEKEGVIITGKDMTVWRSEGRVRVLQGVHMDIEVKQ